MVESGIVFFIGVDKIEQILSIKKYAALHELV
jgi:hypothetical protein